MPLLAIIMLLAALAGPGAWAGRMFNITHYDNCWDFGLTATVHLSKVNYDVNATTGLVDMIHGTYRIKFPDTSDKLLRMTVYTCSKEQASPCKENAQTHDLLMDCHRFRNDNSGPWHAVSQAMTLGVCGETPGEHTFIQRPMEESHIENYVNLNDTRIAHFATRKQFINQENNSTWTCGYIGVALVDTADP